MAKLNKNLPTGDPWLRKNKEKELSYPVSKILRVKKVTGEIGVEVEVEGNKFPKTRDENPLLIDVSPELIPEQWRYHHDGSLRGDDNAEYVFRKPLKFAEVPKAIGDLWEMFQKFGSKLDDSNRTSVHVHLNAQNWHLNRLCAFIALYFAVEEILTEWCGDHRVGNLFCLRAKDAPAIVSKIKQFIQNDGMYPIADGLHYSGLNVHALCKFGSIEIRSLRGCTDPETILQWVSILERLYNLSKEYPDPRTVCDGFSGEGPIAFFDRILGPMAMVVRQGIGWDHQQLMNSMYEGIRLAQDLCYCRDWSEFEPTDFDDPFDRGLVKESVAPTPIMPSPNAALQQYWNNAVGSSPPQISFNQQMAQLVGSVAPATTVEEYPPEPTDEWFTEDYFDDEE